MPRYNFNVVVIGEFDAENITKAWRYIRERFASSLLWRSYRVEYLSEIEENDWLDDSDQS